VGKKTKNRRRFKGGGREFGSSPSPICLLRKRDGGGGEAAAVSGLADGAG